MTDATTALALTVVDEDRAISRPDVEQARAALAHLSATGDVSRMTDEQRAAFILYYCRSLGLNPATGPVEIIEFYDPETKGRVAKVYVKAAATQQLGTLHRIRVETLSEEMVGKGLFKVAVRGHDPDGRTYDEVGYVSLTNRDGSPLAPNAYKNALMKCHTVAKRRLILGMIGLSSPPERADDPQARRRYLGPNGELLEHPTEQERYLNDHPAAGAISGAPRFETQEPPTETGLEGMPDQRPRPEAVRPKRPDGPRPTLGRSEEDVKRLLGAWFAAVKDTSLDDDDARHRYVEQWTASEGWPENKRTASLRTFFARATDAEAADFLAHVRALAADEQRANAEALVESTPKPRRRGNAGAVARNIVVTPLGLSMVSPAVRARIAERERTGS
jgi:hypothetical protein